MKRQGTPAGVLLIGQMITAVIFAAYAVRVLLVLYLTGALGLDDARATLLYGSYNALSFLLPVIVAPVLERRFGALHTVLIGAVLMVAGLIGLAGAAAAAPDLASITAALALVACGFSCVKPAAIVAMGVQFADDEAGRDGGFALYYTGINLGAFAAGLVIGWIGQRIGWSEGFLAGAAVLIFGCIVFGRGAHVVLQPAATGPAPHLVATIATLVLAWAACWFLLNHAALLGWALAVATMGGIVALFWQVRRLGDPAALRHQLALLLLMTAVVATYGIIEQGGSSLALFSQRNVDLRLFDLPVTAAQLSMLNPLFVIALGPLLAWGWGVLARRGIIVGFRAKFLFGLATVSVAPAILWLATFHAAGGHVAIAWVALFWVVAVLGELCVGPVGYAMLTRLAVPRHAAQTVGVWLLAMANSNYVAARLAGLASIEGVDRAAPIASISAYRGLFATLVVAGLAVTLMMLACLPLLWRLTHDLDAAEAR